MSEEQAFLQHLQDDPDDDTTRRIYADWLTDRDDPRGEYLRLDVELARLQEEDPAYAGIEARLRELRSGLDKEWIEKAGKRFDVVLHGYERSKKIPTIVALRVMRSMGIAEAKCFCEILPLCVGVCQARAEAEQWRDRLRAIGEGTIVELAPTWFGRHIYEVLLTDQFRHFQPPIRQILIDILQVDAHEAERLQRPGVLRTGLTLQEAEALLARANLNPRCYFELRRSGS